MNNKQIKPQEKKVVYGAKQSKYGVDWDLEFILQVVFFFFFWKEAMTSLPITLKCCKININGLVPKS